MGQFRAWVEDKRDGWIVRYQDGVTREPSGRFKRFTYDIVEKTQTMTIDGEVRTGKWLANRLAKQAEDEYLRQKMGGVDLSQKVEGLVETFIDFKRVNGLRWSTIADYMNELRAFREECRILTLQDMTEPRIEAWAPAMVKAGFANATIRGRLTVLRVFCRWLVKTKRLGVSPFGDGIIPSEDEPEPKYYTESEWAKLDQAASEINVHARLALNLAYSTGMRKIEIVGDGVMRLEGVLWEDITWYPTGEAEILIRKEIAKGKRSRSILLDEGIVMLLGSRKTGPIVPISRWSLDNHFQRARQKAGINPELDIHGLRHTFAKNYLQRGRGDLGSLQRVMGHRSVTTTERYSQFEKSYLGEAIKKAYEYKIQNQALLLRNVSEPKFGGQLVGNSSKINAQGHTEPHKAAQSSSNVNGANNMRNTAL